MVYYHKFYAGMIALLASMSEVSEEAVLLAIDTRHDLFDSLYEMLSSDNYVRVLMALEQGKSQTEIADDIDTGNSTVSRAITELQEYELIEETDNGFKKSLSSLNHPMIQHFFEKERLNDE
jgi:predicted transcriptional regulator